MQRSRTGSVKKQTIKQTAPQKRKIIIKGRKRNLNLERQIKQHINRLIEKLC